jgi:hypothetical protein
MRRNFSDKIYRGNPKDKFHVRYIFSNSCDVYEKRMRPWMIECNLAQRNLICMLGN